MGTEVWEEQAGSCHLLLCLVIIASRSYAPYLLYTEVVGANKLILERKMNKPIKWISEE